MESRDSGWSRRRTGAPRLIIPSGFIILLLALPAFAQKGRIIDQQVANGEGYTVLKVWGTPTEMGYAQGFLLADAVLQAVSEIKAYAGTNYGLLKMIAGQMLWKSAGIKEEAEGVVAGVKAARSQAEVDSSDVLTVSIFLDGYYLSTGGCRSHSSWGS